MKLGGKSVAVIFLFVGLVLVNYLASQFPARIDLTAGRIYTLSDGTLNLLKKVEEPMTLQFYFSRSLENLPISFKNYASRVEEMLRQYVAHSHGQISLTVIDPRPDTDEETAARRAGVTPRSLSSGEALFFGLIASQADQEKVIEFFSPNREPFLEYDVSQLIHSIQQFNKPHLGVITSLPLRGAEFAMPGQPPSSDQLIVQEWETTFEVVTIEENAETLPDGLNVLAVIHPSDLNAKLQYAIDQFLLSGKPVFIAVDPSSYYFRGRQRQQNMMFSGPQQGVSSDLPQLFKAWGITYDPANVLVDPEHATQVSTSQGVASYPIWLSLEKDQFAADVLPTSSLTSLLVIEGGGISVATDRGYEVTPLVHTGPRTGTVGAMMLGFTPPDQLARQVTGDTAARNLAVMVHGSFKTAFPGGAPKTATPPANPADPNAAPPPPAETPAAANAPTAPALTESTRPGTLVIVADSDWLLDDFSVRHINFLGMQAVEPLNDNLAFASNVMDFIGGSEDLISIRGKGTSQRPFEVIKKMELAAQEKYQSQLQELEKRLGDVQSEITKLQSSESESKRLVVTPEVEEKITRYREQEAAMRTQRRDIRRALREGIELLQNTLTAINLLSVPFAVVAAGVVFLVARSRRQRT